MYAIVVGGGKVGLNLARELLAKGHEVTLVECSRTRYLAIEEELEHSVQYGDGTELWVLERAGIQRADLVVAVTGDDEDNMLVCQVAKEKYRCDHIIARVNNPRNYSHFKLLGIQPVVSATDLILRLIEHEVPRYGLVHLLALEEEGLEIIELEVSAGLGGGGPAARRRRDARRQPLHLGAARRLGLRAQGRHDHRGRRPGAARARAGPRGDGDRLPHVRDSPAPAWLAPRQPASTDGGSSLSVASCPTSGLAVAVRAEDLEVLESVVAAVAVDVVQLQRERVAQPLVDPATLAVARQQAGGEQAALEMVRAPVVRRAAP